MDASAFDTVITAEEGVEFEVKDPRTNKGIGLYLTMLGPDSKAYATKRIEILKKARQGDIIDDDEFQFALAVACTKDWRAEDELKDEKTGETIRVTGAVFLHGEELRFNEGNLKKLYKASPIIANQAKAFLGNRLNFLPTASAS